MGKKIFTAALVIILVAIAAFGVKKYVLSPEKETAAKVFSPEYAIPSAAPDEGAVVVKIIDTRSLRRIVPRVSSYLETNSEDITRDRLRDIAKGFSFLDKANAFLDAVDSLAVSVTPDGEFYASLSVDGEKFDKFAASDDSSFMRLERWDGANIPSGGDAWILKSFPPEIADKPLYMMRWRVGEQNVVNIASEAEKIGEMTEAAGNPEKRLNVARKTEGENFVVLNLREPVEMNGFSLSHAETSWNVKDDGLEIRWYSDMYAPIVAHLTERTFSPGAVPMLGDGEVAFFADIDPAFFISASFPTEPDPIKKALETRGASIPPLFAAGVEDILRNCRISAVAVVKGQAIDTAYMVIETEARGSIDKLYGLARLLAGSSIQLDGWDSAFEVKIDPRFNVIAAQHGGVVLLGIGNAVSFGKKARVPADVVPPPDTSRALVLTATSRILNVKAPSMDETLMDAIKKYQSERNTPVALQNIELLDRLMDRLDRFAFTQSLDGRGEMNITFKE
ncbi:MAG: hypothetical protein LBG12_02625 [Synergistaceae bacterium]|nr:hypothetical protein [Synergistaceae bacterium]